MEVPLSARETPKVRPKSITGEARWFQSPALPEEARKVFLEFLKLSAALVLFGATGLILLLLE